MVKVEHLSKSYNGKSAIKDLTFNLRPGKIYGLLGKNGAGKSTTMNIMTGYLSADNGTVSVDGHDIVKEPIEAKKKIGYLPELPPLYLDMTVYEYLSFAAELKRIEKKNRAFEVDRVMKLSGITEIQNRLIKNLSKGYKQRVGIAEALLGDPEFIVLDEPTVGLDPEQIKEIRKLFESLKEKHIVLISSHILSEVSEVCDNILIINDGRLIVNTEANMLSSYVVEAQTIEVTAKGDKDKAISNLNNIEKVSNVVSDKISDDDTYKYTVTCNTKEDIRAEISMALSSNGIIILEMREVGNDLENMFLEITKNSDEDEAKLREDLSNSDEDNEENKNKSESKKHFSLKKLSQNKMKKEDIEDKDNEEEEDS